MSKRSSIPQKLYTRAFIDEVEGKLLAVASEELPDRDGDIISIEGWQLKNFKKNPIMLWLHNLTDRTEPIGRAENISVKTIDGKKKLVFQPVFEEITDFGQTIAEMFKQKFLNAFSVGFLPIEAEKISDESEWPPRYKFNKQELLEISAVPVPALPTATIMDSAKSLGLNMHIVKSVMDEMKADDPEDPDEENPPESENPLPEDDKKEDEDKSEESEVIKTVVPYKSTGKSDEGAAWSAPSLKDFGHDSWPEASAERTRIASHFTWTKNSPPESFGDVKLPHHKAGSSGTGPSVWRGVSAAMAALLGARGGVDMPANDKRGVYNHLSKHYAEYDKEPPEFRDYTEAELAEIENEPEIKQEKFVLISTEDLVHIKAMLKHLISEVQAQRKDIKKSTNSKVVDSYTVVTALEKFAQILPKAIERANQKSKGGE